MQGGAKAMGFTAALGGGMGGGDTPTPDKETVGCSSSSGVGRIKNTT